MCVCARERQKERGREREKVLGFLYVTDWALSLNNVNYRMWYVWPPRRCTVPCISNVII